MEPTNYREFRREFRPKRRHEYQSGVVPGLILVGIGALFFLNNLHIIYVREWVAYWPVILIAAGIAGLVDNSFAGGRAGGAVLTAVGTILLARNLGYLDLRVRDLWPLLLIGLGLLMLFQRAGFIAEVRGWSDNQSVSENRLNLNAVFGGGKRKVVTPDFQGGTVSAVFGGFDINLRKADIAGDSAVMHVDTIFGGAEIKIPETWRADVQGVGIFGGYTDETVPPDPGHFPNPKRLIVKGTAVFGGVVVKN